MTVGDIGVSERDGNGTYTRVDEDVDETATTTLEPIHKIDNTDSTFAIERRTDLVSWNRTQVVAVMKGLESDSKRSLLQAIAQYREAHPRDAFILYSRDSGAGVKGDTEVIGGLEEEAQTVRSLFMGDESATVTAEQGLGTSYNSGRNSFAAGGAEVTATGETIEGIGVEGEEDEFSDWDEDSDEDGDDGRNCSSPLANATLGSTVSSFETAAGGVGFAALAVSSAKIVGTVGERERQRETWELIDSLEEGLMF